jgi:hypothetical protein
MEDVEQNESSSTAVIVPNGADEDSAEESQLRIVEDDVPIAG